MDNENLSDRIRARAYEIWIASGHRDGQAEQDWLTAEAEILKISSAPSPSTNARSGRRAPPRSKRASASRVIQ